MKEPHHRDRGAVIPLVALLLPVLIVMVAMAVDLGRQRSDRRLAQAGADVVALDMMRVADGRTLQQVLSDPATLVALTESAERNGFVNAVGFVVDTRQPHITNIEWGEVAGDVFEVLDPLVPADLDTVPTAVRISTSRTTDYFFQPGSGSVQRSAVAAYPQPKVDLTVGSVGAGFQPNVPDSLALDATVEALNARLAAHFGATVPNPGTAGFDLVGYRGLAAADVDLRRVAANAGFASPDELLASDMSVGQFFDATVAALDQQAADGDPNAANAAVELRRFQTQMGVDNSARMSLGETLLFEQGGDSAAAVGSLNALDLLSAGAEVIDGTSFLSYQLSPAIPGVAVAHVDQYLVNRATVRRGLPLHGTATNKQLRFQVDLQVAPLLGMTTPVTIPLVIEAAVATGTVDRMTCSDPLTLSEAEIDVLTSGLTVRLGTAADLSADNLAISQGVLIEGDGLTVSALLNLGLSLSQILGLNLTQDTTGSASASVLGGSSQHVFFPYQDPNPYQRAPGGVGALTLGAQLASSLSASLGNSLLGTTATTNLVNQLSYVFDDLDTAIIDPLLASAGVTVAGADVLAENLDCDGAGLKLVG
jgi:uncharacterized membrane protein